MLRKHLGQAQRQQVQEPVIAVEARALLTQPGRSFGARIHAELATKHEALSQAQFNASHAVGLHHRQPARNTNSLGRLRERLQVRVGVDNRGDTSLVHRAFERSHILFDAVSKDERIGIMNDRLAAHRCGARGTFGTRNASLHSGGFGTRGPPRTLGVRKARGVRIFRTIDGVHNAHNIHCASRKLRSRNHARACDSRRSSSTARRCGGECHPVHAIGPTIKNVEHGFPAQPTRCRVLREGFKQLVLGRPACALQ